jgi:hypothetical protein
MIDELKLEIEKTFNRKITDRGHCEALVQDIYEKTNALLSYNTLRRFFGLAEYRKPRENTLDQLAVYCGFRSFKDFSQRYSEVDTWPTWERLFVDLSNEDSTEFIELLRYRKSQNDHFTVSFTIGVRELINRRDLAGLLQVFQEPAFQFSVLPYDEVAQIGVLVGLHFRNFNDQNLEEQLLLEPNFRDIVFKTFVDYARINQKFGRWIEYLIQQPNLDEETIEFITCLDLWRSYLMLGMDSEKKTRRIPDLKMDQHPILFGRIFGMKLLMMKKKSSKSLWETKFKKRLEAQPQFATELLYEPCVQCLVSRNSALMKIIQEYAHLVNDIKFWYHISQVSIHRVFQVACLIDEGQYVKASQILEKITFGHIRHGYREFIELFTSFFKLQIAFKLGEPTEKLQSEFQHYRSKIDYPIFTDEYFEHYFQRSSAKGKNE